MFKMFYLGFMIMLAAILLWLHLQPPDVVQYYVTEEGPIEILSTVGWFLAAGVLAGIVWRCAWSSGWWGVLLLLCCALREMDFHRRFTGQSMLSTRFYFRGSATWELRLLGVSVILILGFACLRLLREVLPRWWDCLKRRELPALTMVAVLALVPLTKALDRLHGTLTDFGLWDQKHLPITFSIFEEVLEFAMPYLAILAILQFYQMHKLDAAGPPGK